MERLGFDIEAYKAAKKNQPKPKRASIGPGGLNTSLNMTMDLEDSFIFKDSPVSKRSITKNSYNNKVACFSPML